MRLVAWMLHLTQGEQIISNQKQENLMLSRIAKLIGYAKAPKATYMVRHPVKGTKALVAAKGAKGLFTTRAGAALAGIIAIPLGVAALRRRGKGEG